MSKAVKEVNEKSERTTLGDLEALAQLKEQMDGDTTAPKAENAPKAKAEPMSYPDAEEGEEESEA
jgi:small subunit ribosomal protein S1